MATGVVAGFAAGALAGAIGSRIAMRISAITAGERFQGAITTLKRGVAKSVLTARSF
jgi:hypothetical protein